MEKHFELSNTEFVQQFIDCKLDPHLFTHEAHLRLAWINVQQNGKEKAETIIQSQLQNFVASVGAKNKYNATLTVAATKAVAHFMARSTTDNFRDFILEYPQLKYNFKELMQAHYSFDLFESVEAKAAYITPDLIPFE